MLIGGPMFAFISRRTAAALAIVAVVFSLTGCDSGGGSGSAFRAELLSVEGDGAMAFGGGSTLIYTSATGPALPTPVGLGVNATLRFKFAGPIDPASLPADGPASGGSIRITTTFSGGAAAVGAWSIDPTDSSTAVFTPVYQAGIASCAGPLTGAFTAGEVYTIEVVGGSSGVRIAGSAIPTTVGMTFGVGNCSQGLNGFADALSGNPVVVGASPEMNGSAPETPLSAIIAPGNTVRVSIEVSEQLDPATVVPSAFEVYNVSANANVAFLVAVTQTELLPAGTYISPTPYSSRVTLTLPRLPDGDAFEIRTSSTPPLDLGGNPLVIAPGTRRFRVADQNDDIDFLVADDFSTTTNLGSVNGFVLWLGDGSIRARPTIFSNGMDGAGVFATSMVLNTNPNSGRFNFTTLSIGNGTSVVTLSLSSQSDDPALATSNHPARFLATQAINLLSQAVVDARGRAGQASAANSGAVPGLGGWGGPGGGNGGISSISTTMSDSAGQPGQGPKDNAVPSVLGGGQGGTSGPLSTVGPSGGGGGSASNIPVRLGTAGEAQGGTGAPAGGAGGSANALFIPPLLDAAGGSGGGAGGDRLDNIAITSHDRGGAGGGGGGGVMFATNTSVNLSSFVSVRTNGGQGGNGPTPFGGDGGAGSGGTVLMLAATVSIGTGSLLDCDGATNPGNDALLNGDGGVGGDGVLQFQDSDGVFPGLGTSILVGETFTGVFNISGNVTGLATSNVIDTGSSSVEFLTSNTLGQTGFIGTIPSGSSLTVTVVGIAEDPFNPGQPALATPSLVTAPVALTDIGMLNGYRFIRFQVGVSFPSNIFAQLNAQVPLCDSLSIAYRR